MVSEQVVGILLLCYCSIGVIGCNSRHERPRGAEGVFSSDVEMQDAVASLAPAGGNGTKIHSYPGGEIKEIAYWNDYNVLKIEYYTPSGELIYTAFLDKGSGVLIELSDSGDITKVYQSKNYEKRGLELVINDGTISSIHSINQEGQVKTYSLK